MMLQYNFFDTCEKVKKMTQKCQVSQQQLIRAHSDTHRHTVTDIACVHLNGQKMDKKKKSSNPCYFG